MTIALFWGVFEFYNFSEVKEYNNEIALVINGSLVFFFARMIQLICQINPLFQELFAYLKSKGVKIENTDEKKIGDENEKIIKAATIVVLALTSFGATSQVFAAVGDQGVDWSKYNGYQGNFGYANDKFSIAQIGGTYGGYYVDQLTYNSQVQNTLGQGKRAHTYIWYQVGGSIELSKGVLDRYLPQIATPKDSIVALDYESGASGSKQANTDAILYGMRRVKEAGYTPMYYSYKPYTIANVDYKRITKEFWITLDCGISKL